MTRYAHDTDTGWQFFGGRLRFGHSQFKRYLVVSAFYHSFELAVWNG